MVAEKLSYRIAIPCFRKPTNRMENMCIYKVLKLVSKNNVRINSTFSILNKNGDTRITKKFEGLVEPTYTVYNEYGSYITLSSLHSEADSYYFFTTVCEMNILKESPKHENPESSLINHLSKLYETHKYSDVILNVKGTEFRVHKALLASRSDVFALMFDNEFKETQTNRVDMNDMDEDVVQEMLKFIYTGQSPNLKKMALDLLQAGDKYALEDLKAMCASELCHKIELDTAIQTLILADRHHVDQLKIQSMDFIAVNAHSIRKTDCWTQLKNEYPLLYVEMLERKFFGGEH